MAKHIKIPISSFAHARVDLDRFAECARQLQDNPRPLVRWPLSWFDALLLARTSDGRVELTPRGEDLLASIDSIPNDPEPEVKVTPCRKCNGTGEQPLFVSMETCSRCKGDKVEPFNREPSAVSGHSWVLIDSEEVAQQFVGKRVEVDAPATGVFSYHGLHQTRVMLERCDSLSLITSHGALIWSFRGNVHLRLVNGDPS